MAKTLTSLEKDPHQVMLDLYPTMLLDKRGIQGYTDFFEILLSTDEGAILWHCSAGKDRAGLASVLLLSVLGVPREAIVLDYLATNQNLAGRVDDLKKLIPPEYCSEEILKSLEIFNTADEAFLDAGIKAVEDEYGSLGSYLKNALGVDDEVKEALRRRYLTRSRCG